MALRQRIGLMRARLFRLPVLLVPGLLVLGPVTPATAAVGPPSLDVQISRLTPAVITPGADLTVRGYVHNPDRRVATGVQVYLAVTADPFLSHQQARDAIRRGTGELGHRLLERGLVDSLGKVRPGATERFSLTVPHELLGLSGAQGVYGMSVHARTATDASAGHAATLLPLRPDGRPKAVPTTVVWPFLRPSTGLEKSIARGGQLRNLLNLARAAPRRGSDILVDPALLIHAQAIANSPDDVSDAHRRAARDFLDDLVDLARDRECWSTSFDRPDFVALQASSAELRAVVRRATEGTLRPYELSCDRLEWPATAGLSRSLLGSIRDSGSDAVIVAPSTVPNWQSQSGPVIEAVAPEKRISLVVQDPVDAEAAGERSPLTLRQRILSEATWSALAGSGGATVVVVDPRWNPGTSGGGHLDVAMQNKYVAGIGLDEQLEKRRAPYDGPVLSRAKAQSISLDQIGSALDAAHTQQLLGRVLVEREANVAHDRRITTAVSQRWRPHRRAGEAYARDVNDDLHEELADISVEGPAALTLSSQTGRFPVTVKNKTEHRVRVGTLMESSNPRVTVAVPKGSVISAGESRTVTAAIDLDGQSSATVSIHLTTPDGAMLGAPSVFNVRSSRVGAALWVAIGLSVVFVAIALIRRFVRPGHRPDHPTLPPDDFDD
ncbi:MAG TPA: DUF6049 family protein [Aeromicrobium sp.]|nr:DUF6049 family protein [Aeromicrobium sp.]